MYLPLVFIRGAFPFEVDLTHVAIRIACRSLVLFEATTEVEPLVAVWTVVVVKGLAVASEAPRGSEQAVAVMTETVVCGTLVRCQCVCSAEATEAIIARGHAEQLESFKCNIALLVLLPLSNFEQEGGSEETLLFSRLQCRLNYHRICWPIRFASWTLS